jgi:peptidoglycan/xylan/chitin deacetylase (PgdA/CDA1 family)
VIGQNVERYPDLVRRMAAEGHAVGHHSFLHSDPRQTPARQLLEEIQRTQDLLIPLLSKPSTLFRPPHGKVTAWKLWSLWRAGQTVVLWNSDSKDYACRSAEELRTWFASHPPSGGDIVLMHDNHPHAAEALPGLVPAVRQSGLRFATVPEWVSPIVS